MNETHNNDSAYNPMAGTVRRQVFNEPDEEPHYAWVNSESVREEENRVREMVRAIKRDLNVKGGR
jgi:hypothetical protein